MSSITKINYQKLQSDINILAFKLDSSKYDGIYGIPRGGVIIGALLANKMGIQLVDAPTSKTLIVDDLIDSGKTLKPYLKQGNDIAVLYRKPYSPFNTIYTVETINNWVEFPFESTENDIYDNILRIIQYTDNKEVKTKIINLAKEILVDTKISLDELTIKE